VEAVEVYLVLLAVVVAVVDLEHCSLVFVEPHLENWGLALLHHSPWGSKGSEIDYSLAAVERGWVVFEWAGLEAVGPLEAGPGFVVVA
jgi:hypothetical protein